ncbi:hypothetical protein HGRIS_014340 [Hohenbuehelia grisea]|uniref:Uncharacterized protein n=1 Tax=Hohenbuehelia grisea TaxID=104357 RepID=A0ABR3JUV2_9AGAR
MYPTFLLAALSLATHAFAAPIPAPRPAPAPAPRVGLSPLHPRQNVPAIGAGPATAPDGSTIIEDEVVINGLNMRFKVSAPASALVANANANAGAGAGAGAGALGINVLFHGDGGQSFFDFPNAGVNAGLMGVALLSPDPTVRWGGSDPRNSLIRPQGAAHSAAVNQFITTELPKIVNFDKSKIFLEGISGGSLLLSGFTVPTFGASLGVKGVVMGCGGLAPQVRVQGDISGIRVHWQSSTDELAELKQSIPPAIAAYEQIARGAGLSNAQVNALQTVDASPDGGHCAFDEQDFVSGVQLLTDNYSSILAGQGVLNGVAAVGSKGVVGNENPFVAAVGAGAGAGAGVAAGTGTSAAGVVNANAANTANAGGIGIGRQRGRGRGRVNRLN